MVGGSGPPLAVKIRVGSHTAEEALESDWQRINVPSAKDHSGNQEGASSSNEEGSSADFNSSVFPLSLSDISNESSVTDITKNIFWTQNSLGTITETPGDTCPNTPSPNYHIYYGCKIHGPQNHYGPYCDCSLSVLDVNMPHLLDDGTLTPICSDGHIPWPPVTSVPQIPQPQYDGLAMAGPSVDPALVAPQTTPATQTGRFYTVFVGIETGVFDDWYVNC